MANIKSRGLKNNWEKPTKLHPHLCSSLSGFTINIINEFYKFIIGQLKVLFAIVFKQFFYKNKKDITLACKIKYHKI